MTAARHLRIFLDADLLASAIAGTHNFINKIVGAVTVHGYSVEFCPDDDAANALAAQNDGAFSLFHMRHPVGPRALVFRRAYHYPFWAIEPSAERWNWHVAKSSFDPAAIDGEEAARFARFWRKRIFGQPQLATTQEGFLYLPLQGRLTEHRSFQSCSPIQMIRAVLDNDNRPVVAALHSKESYSDTDHAALDDLTKLYPRLTVTTGGMDRFLPACDAVITQNSSVAFNGYFLHKPAVLFAGIDFHHIARDASANPALALSGLADHRPDYDRYLFWYWQKMSINAGRPEAEAQICAALDRAGWPLT